MTRTAIAIAAMIATAVPAVADAGDTFFLCEDGTGVIYDDSSRAMFVTGVIPGFKLAIAHRTNGDGYALFTPIKGRAYRCDARVVPCVEAAGSTGDFVVTYMLSPDSPVVRCAETDAIPTQ